MKNLLVMIALIGASVASAKTYNIKLSSPAAIGNSLLKSGEYRLEIKGGRVLLKNGKVVDEFPVQVQNEARKNVETSVTVSSEGGSSRLKEIRLVGTNVKLVFNN